MDLNLVTWLQDLPPTISILLTNTMAGDKVFKKGEKSEFRESRKEYVLQLIF